MTLSTREMALVAALTISVALLLYTLYVCRKTKETFYACKEAPVKADDKTDKVDINKYKDKQKELQVITGLKAKLCRLPTQKEFEAAMKGRK